MKQIYSLLLLFSLFLGFASCSDDDDNVVKTLALDQDLVTITLDIDNKAIINIKEGAGEYEAVSLQPEIATVEIQGNSIIIEGLKLGTADILVMDSKTTVKNLQVINQYDKLSFEKDIINLEHFVGKQASAEFFPIGNGQYEVTVEDENIITAEGTANSIILKNLVEKGNTKIKITDVKGKELVIPVEITTTIKPYTNKELEDFMKNTDYTFVWNDSWTYPNELINEMDGNMNILGASYYSSHLKVFFTGDKSPGEKMGAKLEHKTWSQTNNYDLSYFEIVKNDGTKLWAVYSYVDEERNIGMMGQMITNINN